MPASHRLNSPYETARKFGFTTTVAVLLVTGWYLYYGRPTVRNTNITPSATPILAAAMPPVAQPTPSVSTPDPPKPSTTATPSPQSLQNAVSAATAKYPGITFGVSIIDLKTGQQTDINAGQPMFAASTGKLIAAIPYLQAVQSGRYNLNDELGTYSAGFQLEQLINQSNNDSWDLFNDLLGLSTETAFARSIGLTTYDADNNEISPHDEAILLEKLYEGQLLNTHYTNLLLSYMHDTEEEQFIPPAVPSTDKLYHKVGLYEDNVNDVAIIDNGSQPIVLTIYSNGHGTWGYDDRADMFHDIVKAVLNYFNQS